MRFKEFRLDPTDRDTPDYADHLTENKVPSRRTIQPDVETVSINDGSAGGIALVGIMQDWLRKKGVQIFLETRATGVIMENGHAIGLEAERDGKAIRIRANKGVIFGTGGYAHVCVIRGDLPVPRVARGGTCNPLPVLYKEAGNFSAFHADGKMHRHLAVSCYACVPVTGGSVF